MGPAVTRLSLVLGAVRGLGYQAWPREEGRLALIEARERRSLLRRLWVAGLGMMQVMMYAVPGYIAADGEIAADAASLMRWAGWSSRCRWWVTPRLPSSAVRGATCA
jgi:Cu2+-exporting ATPase